MSTITTHPIFLLGLGIRILLIFSLAPVAMSDWYLPFLNVSTSILTINPWHHWLEAGGSDLVFPYGYIMFFVFSPFIILAKIFGISLAYAYSFTILLIDIALLITLNKLLSNKSKFILLTYWLSPIIILASYGLGFNDLVPVLFLTLAILSIRKLLFGIAGIFCAAAISAKISMIVAIPFFCIYLFNNKALRKSLPKYIYSFSLAASILILPVLVFSAGSTMILANPELSKIYDLRITLTENIFIYIVPLIFLIFLYFSWRLRRLNFDLFLTLTGVGFLLIILLTPASLGWFVWSIPFLIINQAKSDKTSIILNGIFTFIYTINLLLFTPIFFWSGQSYIMGDILPFINHFNSHSESIMHTTIVAVGSVLAFRMLREAIRLNDFFKLGRKPFVIGLAGDSGSGKDTLVLAIKDLIGSHSVVNLSGDNYHLWDRKKPMWQVMTHLNPVANDLERFSRDLFLLISKQNIQSRSYDHSSGKMGKPLTVKSNDFIIASGLHTLYFPALRDSYDLKIFLDIDDQLRRFFKIQRDRHKRNHSMEEILKTIEKRENDSKRFIKPQKKFADLSLSLQPVNPIFPITCDLDNIPKLKLKITARAGFPQSSLNRVLVGICGLSLDLSYDPHREEIIMTFEGEFSEHDSKVAAELLCPEVLEFLDISPKWKSGMLGLMQVIVFVYVNEIFRKKLSD